MRSDATMPAALAAVEGIGLSGQMHGAVLLDAAGEVLRPAILWNDVRAAAECAELEGGVPGAAAGHRQHRHARLHRAQAAVGARHEPDGVRPRAHGAAAEGLDPLPPDGRNDRGDVRRLRHAVAGRRRARLVGRGCWPPPACRARRDAAAGGGQRRLPARCVPSWPRAGAWRGRPVLAGGAGDNAAGAVGLSAIRPGDAFVSLGTSGVLFATTDRLPAVSAGGGARVLPRAARDLAPDGRHAVGRGVAGLVGRRHRAVPRRHCWPRSARRRQPSPALFLPYLGGERTPHNDGAIRGAFAGLSHDTDRAAMTQAVLEGVAFSLRDCLDALAASGTSVETADVIGGGSRSARLDRDHRRRAGHPAAPLGGRRARRRVRRGAAGADGGDRRGARNGVHPART